MRRVVISLLAAPVVGCSSMSVGVWADSDHGRSVAAVASIELPPEPVAARENKPAASTKTAPVPSKNSKDEWEVAVRAKSEPPAKIPSATKPASDAPSVKVETESWTPRGNPNAKPPEFDCDPKAYAWIQGRLSYVKIGGNRVWKVRFAPYDRIDRYGGSFVLQGKMPADLKEGDLVRIEGSPVDSQPDSRSPRYKCDQITILHRNEAGK